MKLDQHRLSDLNNREEKSLKKKKKESLRGLWDNIKKSNMQSLESKGRKRKNAVHKKIFTEIMAERFPNFTTDINLKMQEAQ